MSLRLAAMASLLVLAGCASVPDQGSGLHPGDLVELRVASAAADWTGEEEARTAFGKKLVSRLEFPEGAQYTVDQVSPRFFTVTRFDTLYCPISAARALR